MLASLGNSPETEGKQTLHHSLKPVSTPQLNQQTHAGKNNEGKRETQYMLMGVKQPCPLTWAYRKHRITNSIIFSTKLQAQMTKVVQITVFSVPWPSTTLVDSLSISSSSSWGMTWPDVQCRRAPGQELLSLQTAAVHQDWILTTGEARKACVFKSGIFNFPSTSTVMWMDCSSREILLKAAWKSKTFCVLGDAHTLRD